MSKFLGPIHYWLYGKIGHQEELTRCLAEAALKEGRLADFSSYVRDLPRLETVIDEGNIHGWLQSRITDAEKRYAALVLTLTAQEPDPLDSLIREAYAFGTQHALPAGTTPAEAYKAFEDFFRQWYALRSGQPCHREHRPGCIMDADKGPARRSLVRSGRRREHLLSTAQKRYGWNALRERPATVHAGFKPLHNTTCLNLLRAVLRPELIYAAAFPAPEHPIFEFPVL